MTELANYENTRLDVAVIPTFDQAQTLMDSLDTMGRNVQWWIGDFLNYAEQWFPETWTQLIPDIGWDKKTLMNWKFVCENVRKNARYENISFSHHEAVAGLYPEQQDYFLKLASEANLTVKQLREEIRGPKQEKPPKMITVCCPHCERNFEYEV